MVKQRAFDVHVFVQSGAWNVEERCLIVLVKGFGVMAVPPLKVGWYFCGGVIRWLGSGSSG